MAGNSVLDRLDVGDDLSLLNREKFDTFFFLTFSMCVFVGEGKLTIHRKNNTNTTSSTFRKTARRDGQLNVTFERRFLNEAFLFKNC